MTRTAWKPLLLALLAIDAAYYALAGTPSKAIDAVAWLTLLVLFELESMLVEAPTRPALPAALRLGRLAAAGGVVVATIGYVFEEDALDAVNSALWIAVVVMLEIEFRFPALVAKGRAAFAAAACALYGSLALLVTIWAWRGAWFDAWDAALWIVAFATLEIDAVDSALKQR